MLKQIKKYVPRPIKQILAPVYRRTFGGWQKLYLFLRMQKKHQILLAKIKGKKRIRVIFLAIHKSIWKVDPVFQKMLADPFFEPIILVCPYTIYGEERMREDMRECLTYFKEKGYPTYSSYKDEEMRWINLSELQPDIIFFTNPNNLTRSEYFSEAYECYLSFYVPYYFMVTDHAGNIYDVYDSPLLRAAFRIFWPNDYHLLQQKKVLKIPVKNAVVAGYPAVENLLNISDARCVWKQQCMPKKKIIYAPHHTIDHNEQSLSSFLYLADYIQALAEDFSETVQWSFKPHPILKSKLIMHKNWGKERTERYYNFWANNEFTQLDEGEYDALFVQSDAIIHDSSSFIAEYVFTGKPGMYLMKAKRANSIVNDFGKIFLPHYRLSDEPLEIEKFVKEVVNECVEEVSENKDLSSYIQNYFISNKPSEFIINDIKKVLLGGSL